MRVPSEGARSPRWLVRSLQVVGATLTAQSRALRIVLMFAWGTWIWFLSANQLPSTGYIPFASVLGNMAHAPVFGLLGLLAIAALAPRPESRHAWPRIERKHLLGGIGLVLAYALVDELHQSFTPGRSPSFGDVLTDVLGAGAVAATIHRIDPRGPNGQRLLRLWGLALLAILASATLADALGFFGVEPAEIVQPK